MSLIREISRAAVGGSLKVVRLPADTALRLRHRNGGSSAAGIALDRIEARARDVAGRALRDGELREDAELRRVAADERERALRLRSEAEVRTAGAEERYEQRKEQTQKQQTQATRRAQQKRRSAAQQREATTQQVERVREQREEVERGRGRADRGGRRPACKAGSSGPARPRGRGAGQAREGAGRRR